MLVFGPIAVQVGGLRGLRSVCVGVNSTFGKRFASQRFLERVQE